MTEELIGVRKERPSKEELEREYQTQGIKTLGDKYGVHQQTISRWLSEYGIEKRKSGDNINLAIKREEKQRWHRRYPELVNIDFDLLTGNVEGISSLDVFETKPKNYKPPKFSDLEISAFKSAADELHFKSGEYNAPSVLYVKKGDRVFAGEIHLSRHLTYRRER